MAALKIILFTATWATALGFYDWSASWNIDYTSSMEAGTLDKSDKLLYTINSVYSNDTGAEVSYRDIGINGNNNIIITYLNAIEMGQHPDASAIIQEGGPDQSNVVIRLIPGFSNRFNYTVNVYVKKIPRSFEKCYHKYELTYYKRNETESNYDDDVNAMLA